MSRIKKSLLAMVLLIAIFIFVGRMEAEKSALQYSRTLNSAISVVSVSGFSDTPKVRAYFASPEMSALRSRLEMLSVFGGDYCALSDELQQGIIYLSEQMALAPAQRFATPLALSHLSFSCDDRTDEGIAACAAELIMSYEAKL